VLVAVPDGVVRDHLYLPWAIVGTTAVIRVDELIVKLAGVAPRLTAVTPVKLEPVIVTNWPA
jgi:hypothetical protein